MYPILFQEFKPVSPEEKQPTSLLSPSAETRLSHRHSRAEQNTDSVLLNLPSRQNAMGRAERDENGNVVFIGSTPPAPKEEPRETPESPEGYYSAEELSEKYKATRKRVLELGREQKLPAIEIKGWKAIGNKLIDKKLISIKEIKGPEEGDDADDDGGDDTPSGGQGGVQGDLFGSQESGKSKAEKQVKGKAGEKDKAGKKGKSGKDSFLHTGDTIEFDV